jgi:A/G-specific adenine glycosylase
MRLLPRRGEESVGRTGSLRSEEPLGGQGRWAGGTPALLTWFDAHKRDLPWRRTRDPYAIWVSEVMLQQTQVATVIPYYERFLARFPDANALARAKLPEVLALWSGLGYYARARNLHRAAQVIARDGMPRTVAALRELPGLGRYTAAAVGSIAFGERAAVLDGNVARVLARLLALDAPLASLTPRLWREAEALLDPARPGAFNEAMMELGAVQCLPARPRCSDCPLAAFCESRRRGLEARIPPPKPRALPLRLELACAAVSRGHAILLGRREERGLFGGLWELPSVEPSGRPPSRALETLGFAVLDDAPLAQVERTLTHRKLHLTVYRCRRIGRSKHGYRALRFVPLDRIGELGISTAMARAIEASRAGK